MERLNYPSIETFPTRLLGIGVGKGVAEYLGENL
jgi:hypothetical protein